MRKSEAIETLAVTLIFDPDSVGVFRSSTWLRHLMIGGKPICPTRFTRLDQISFLETFGIEDYMSRNWSWGYMGYCCHNCSDIWREAIWKRNGMLAETQRGGG